MTAQFPTLTGDVIAQRIRSARIHRKSRRAVMLAFIRESAHRAALSRKK